MTEDQDCRPGNVSWTETNNQQIQQPVQDERTVKGSLPEAFHVYPAFSKCELRLGLRVARRRAKNISKAPNILH